MSLDAAEAGRVQLLDCGLLACEKRVWRSDHLRRQGSTTLDNVKTKRKDLRIFPFVSGRKAGAIRALACGVAAAVADAHQRLSIPWGAQALGHGGRREALHPRAHGEQRHGRQLQAWHAWRRHGGTVQ